MPNHAPSVSGAASLEDLDAGSRRSLARGHSCQYLRHMVYLYRALHARKPSRDVEKAAEIAAQQGVRADLLDLGHLIRHHPRRDLRILHAEGTPETAAHAGVRHLRYLHPHDAGKKNPRLIPDAQLAQSRTGIVVGDYPVIGRVPRMNPVRLVGSPDTAHIR